MKMSNREKLAKQFNQTDNQCKIKNKMYPIFEWTIMLNFIVSCEGEERAQTLHLNFVSTMETVLWGGQNQNVKL